ncbi:MAG: hypothetical protein J5493_08425 [Lachnospiraceae bacterium]|nr:hypothetical protein [Lachnospiraceae bacterium]
MKKTILLILSLIVFSSLLFPCRVMANRLQPETIDDQEYYTLILRKDGTVGTATVAEIDKMIFERNLAILSGDTEREIIIQQEMYNAGVYPSTEEELSVFIDNKKASLPSRGMSSVSYDTTYYSISGYDGNIYEIKRITTHPTMNCNLYHTATVSQKTISSSVSAGLYKLCKVIGSVAAGLAYNASNAFITAYDALHSVISGFYSTTTVYNITATYVCAALEQVSFYEYKVSGYWTPFASSSYIQTGFSSTVFSVNYSGGSQQGLNMSVT